MALIRAALDEVGELGDRVPHLVLRVEEVRAEPDPSRGVGAEVADDPAHGELPMARRVVGRRDGDRATSPLWLTRGDDLEARLVAEIDQELGQRERALANPSDSHLLDHVVAGGRRVERGNVRGAGEESPRAGRVLQLRLEGERPGVRLPADEG